MRRVRVRLGAGVDYEIEIGRGALDGLGEAAQRSLSPRARTLALISNARVFKLYGERAVRRLRAAGFRVAPWLMGDGERHKSFQTAERALAFLSETGLERSDAVVALGGGVVGDLAGFVAAVYLRGIAYVQVPTTLLAQIDSSVGGKTAVNMPAGKNLAGVFHQPRAVVIDTDSLLTLPPREMTAGWCEAIKQGAVGERKLFDQTYRFLADAQGNQSFRESFAGASRKRSGEVLWERDVEAGRRGAGKDWVEALAKLIAAQCAFKAAVVGGDEREDVGRTDARSRRILNFGHTVAHALEAVTRYRRFRHGEAVGYGMLAAAEISVRLGLLDVSELELLRHSIRLAGRLPRADDLDKATILGALRGDKKSVGGHVQWVLLEELGGARIVNGKEIPPRVVRAALDAALRR